MGTPDFAVPSLDILVKNGYDIAAVITATDKMGGRGGKQILQSAVKKYAVDNNLRVLQPEKLKNPEFIDILRGINADLFIVVAFRMLPEIVWTMPPLGTFNLHGSLLPKYRGAAPLNWAIINGEKETGVTTFFLKHEIDTGDIIFRESVPIGEDETVGEVHDKMMILGANTVLKTVKAIENQKITPLPQLDIAATHAPKIFQETCEINFDKTTAEVHNFIRGLSPFPTAWTTLNGLKLKIFKASKEVNSDLINNEIKSELINSELINSDLFNLKTINSEITPPQYKSDFEPILTGKFVSDGKNYLKITTADGFIQLLDVQLEGRKRMTIKDFLNGYRL
jgi:methionyl-tRNA formyltransferase